MNDQLRSPTMNEFVAEAREDAALLQKSQELSATYWQSFKRDSRAGRATTDAGPKVIIPAKVLAINLFNTLDETLGEVGSHLVLYGIGKTWGAFSAEHFKEWAKTHSIDGQVLRYGAMYFPMHVGLTPRLDVIAVDYHELNCFVVQVHNSILSETRHKNGLDTEPAHWMVSGWIAGCISSELNGTYEARAVPNSGDTSYRVVVAQGAQMGHVNLSDPFWLSDLSSFQTITINAE
jgi:predicted hydrocarbon binding protein